MCRQNPQKAQGRGWGHPLLFPVWPPALQLQLALGVRLGLLTPIETHVGGGGGGEQTGDYLEASLPSALLRVSDGLAGEAEGRGLEESSCCKPRHCLYRNHPPTQARSAGCRPASGPRAGEGGRSSGWGGPCSLHLGQVGMLILLIRAFLCQTPCSALCSYASQLTPRGRCFLQQCPQC